MAVSSKTLVTGSAYGEQLYELLHNFFPDWSKGIVLETSYKTDISTTTTGHQRRTGMFARPRRKISAALRGYDHHDSRAILDAARRVCQAASLAPVFCDITDARANTSHTAGDNAILLEEGDTANRRFAAEQWVMIAELDKDSQPLHFEITEITAVGSNVLSISPNLSNDYAANRTVVMPVMEATQTQQQKGVSLTDGMREWAYEVLERDDDTRLPATQAANTTPTGIEEFDGLPIFDFFVDWGTNPQWSYEYEGSVLSAGNAKVPNFYGSKPKFKDKIRCRFSTRADAFKLIRFFDSRKGRLYPFLFVRPSTDFDRPKSMNANSMTFDAVGTQLDYQQDTYLYLRTFDGQSCVRKIQSVSAATGPGSEVTIQVTTGFPGGFDATTTERVSICYKAAFGSDTLKENWYTDQSMYCDIEVEELPDQSDSVTASNLDRTTTSDLSAAFDPYDPFCSGRKALVSKAYPVKQFNNVLDYYADTEYGPFIEAFPIEGSSELFTVDDAEEDKFNPWDTSEGDGPVSGRVWGVHATLQPDESLIRTNHLLVRFSDIYIPDNERAVQVDFDVVTTNRTHGWDHDNATTWQIMGLWNDPGHSEKQIYQSIFTVLDYGQFLNPFELFTHETFTWMRSNDWISNGRTGQGPLDHISFPYDETIVTAYLDDNEIWNSENGKFFGALLMVRAGQGTTIDYDNRDRVEIVSITATVTTELR